MRFLGGVGEALLHEILARAGRPVDDVVLRDLVNVIDGAVISAIIEADPDPRAAARDALLRTL